MIEDVVLVDVDDNPLGTMDKLEAHQKGALHRAFSVFIFNDKKELLLQQRSFEKYHSGGLWTNTCCSHPQESENVQEACQRRLIEEMGFTTDLDFVTTFIYKANLDHDLIEHELDHVYIGNYNDSPKPNSNEVCNWKYINLSELEQDMDLFPENYTVWFKIIYAKVKNHLMANS